MTGFVTVPVELQVTGSQLLRVVDDVDSAAAPLRVEADGLLGGSWRGAAAAGFAVGWREWLAGYTDVVAALAQFADQTSASGRAYTAVDDDGRTTLRAAGAA